MTGVNKSNNRRGFTLAEVLITLGIIGVVAAMTIPNLIANTRSSQYRSAFKKAVSTLSQAARMSEAQYGFDYAGITQRCGASPATEHPEEVMSICSILNGTLSGATYLGRANTLQMKSGNTSKNYSITVSSQFFNNFSTLKNLSGHAYSFADGTIMVIPADFGVNACTLSAGNVLTDKMVVGDEAYACAVFVDVNGTSLPNKEVSCSSGTNSLASNDCVVKNDAQHMTDIFPLRLYDGVAVPATAAARYVLNSTK
ncbi:type II secretion system protein [bacterium]|nr:type II secretion system protein [bacterium]